MASRKLCFAGMRLISRLDKGLLGAVFLYLLGGLLLLDSFRYQINPDAVSYISIAQHYRDGQWAEALNAYWSPLYSWLLLPFVYLGSDPLAATKIVNLGIGIFVLTGAWRLAVVVHLNRSFQRALVFVLAPVVLQWAYSVVTPDLLTLALLLGFLEIVLRENLLKKPGAALLAGTVGGCAFLSKAYALPYAIAIAVICLVWQGVAFRHRLGVILRQAVLFGLGLAALALPWITAISLKYHRLTLGTAGHFNFALIGPKSFWYPMLTLGLFAPPNGHAVSAWEDPTFLPTRAWSPFSSLSFFLFWLRKIVSNCGDLFSFLNAFSLCAIPIIIAAGFFLIAENRRRRGYHPAMAFYIAVAVFAGGYLLVFLEQRYIWICAVGLLICAFNSVQFWRERGTLGRMTTTGISALVSLSFVAPAVIGLLDNFEIDLEYHEASEKLPLPKGATFASNDITSLYFGYYKRAAFYGMPQESPEDLREQLLRYRVDYYLWRGAAAAPESLRHLPRIDSGNIPNLQLYKVSGSESPSSVSQASR